MRFHIISLFPESFRSYFGESLFKRAIAKKIVDVRIHDLRAYATDRRRTVDDRPFGGGPGMVLKFEPIAKASARLQKKEARKKVRTILFSTRGRELDDATARRLAKYDALILICGRYEGVDERVAEHIADEEISIGKYVLSGGELPALVLIETVARKLSGFLGKRASLEELKGSYPVYTRPEVLRFGKRKLRVPKVLLEGDHAKIAAWRKKTR